MSKPAALNDDEMKYIELCLRNHWPFLENKHRLVAGLYAMAAERNALLAEKAREATTAVNQVYG